MESNKLRLNEYTWSKLTFDDYSRQWEMQDKLVFKSFKRSRRYKTKVKDIKRIKFTFEICPKSFPFSVKVPIFPMSITYLVRGNAIMFSSNASDNFKSLPLYWQLVIHKSIDL